tara:strand:- start:8836 stop:10467 length:1632 start_codon:yes stop_codon:yes gene_type:complete
MSTPSPKIKHVSASQFKTYSLCQRKWYIEKCTDAPRPEPSAAMLLGTAVHAILEDYVSEGTDIPDTREGRIARTALKYIPTSTDLHVELSLRMESIDPPLVGFIDLYDTMDPSCPVVIDYKTTSSWKWARKEEQLLADPQMIAYAQYALEQHPSANEVIVAHIQLKTKGAPEGRLVSVELTREHVAEQWAKLVELAAEMKQTSYLDSVEEVPPTLSACGAFGGCPFADTCAALSPVTNPFAGISEVGNKNKEEKMSRLQELRDRKKKASLPPSPPVNGTPRPTGVLSSDAASRVVEVEAVEAEEVEEVAAPTELVFTEPVPAKDNYSDEQYDEAAKALLAHMRDRSVPRVGKVAAKTIVGKVLDLRRVRLYYVEKACLFSEGTLDYTEGTVLRASALPTHRGSYDHETGESFPSEDSVAQKKKEEKAEKKKAPAPEPVIIEEAPVQEAAAGLTVYIDCLPVKGITGAVSFEDLIFPLVTKVAENNKVATPLQMQYGEGKNHVAGLLRVSDLKGSVLVSSDNPYWAACKTVLVQAADAVIQGIR